MKKVERFQTLDGTEHKTVKAALRHLDNLYGSAVCKLARQLCQIDKYQATLDFIDKNLGLFEELIRLKGDTEFERSDEDS